MAFLTQKKFDFVSHALPPDTFGVVRFEGVEGLSTCYRFEIMLVASDPEIDLSAVLKHPATFTILREDGDIPFHGIISQFEQLHAMDEYVFYRAILSPKLWWLSLTHHNQIFLGEPDAEDNTIPMILEAVFKDGGLTTNDFELKLSGDYLSWEYICQYGESHLNFLSRWMEREGMYYYFEQDINAEKVIVTDTNLSHLEMAEGKTMYYSPPSGLVEPFREEVMHAFICKQTLLPGKLHVKDYNYRTPSLDLSAQAEVTDHGRGEVHIYGEHFRTLQEGNTLAGIRAQALLSRERRFFGESTIPYLRPGYRFDLEDHYREGFNQKYLTIELSHAGSQTAYLTAGVQQGLSEAEERSYYRNSFVAIPAEVQYRHPQEIQKPLFSGTVNARVDAEGSGEFAELDEHGRYKVKLPFDLSGRAGGKASSWLRMAQPYAGENQGMHFPLHKNTEVLLTFIEGDPDRPIIAAAVPNPETISPITGGNQSRSIIQTGPGPGTGSVGAEYKLGSANNNFVEFEDDANASGGQYVKIFSPNKVEVVAGGRYKRRELGPSEESGHDKYKYDNTGAQFTTTEANDETDDLYNTFFQFAPSNVYGYDEKAELDESTATPPAGFPEEYIEAPIPDPASDFETYHAAAESDTAKTTGPSDDESKENLRDLVAVTPAWEDYWRYWVMINKSNAKGYQNVKFYYPEAQDDGTFHENSGKPWYLSYVPPADTTTWDSHCLTKWDAWVTEKTADWKKWQPHVVRGHVRVSHRDTFNIQEGHIYDFGGYWVYNLGNCYIEDHLDQNAELNAIYPDDLLDAGGPHWTKVEWDKIRGSTDVDSRPTVGNVDIGSAGDWDNSSGSTNVWVNKRFGRSYTYQEVDSIEITKGSSVNVLHGGGDHVDIMIRDGGNYKSWSWLAPDLSTKKEKKWTSKGNLFYDYDYANGIATTEEWNWAVYRGTDSSKKETSSTELKKLSKKVVDYYEGTASTHTHCRDTGAILAFSSKHQGANSTHSFDFNWANTAKASFTFASGAYFSFNAAIKVGISVDLALAASYSFNLAPTIKINTTLGLSLDVKTGAGYGLELDWRVGGTTKINPAGGLKFHGMGVTGRKKALLDAQKATAKAKSIDANIESTNIALLKVIAALHQNDITVFG